MLKRIDSIRGEVQRDDSNMNFEEITMYLAQLEKENAGKTYEELLEEKEFSIDAMKLGELLIEEPVDEVVSLAVLEKVDSVLLAEAFLFASKKQQKESKKRIEENDLSTTELALNEKDQVELQKNLYKNWVRLLIEDGNSFLGVEQVSNKDGYFFSTKAKMHTLFAQEINNYRNGLNHAIKIVKNKIMLTIGIVGAGVDEEYFLENGAKKIITIENNSYFREKLSQNLEKYMAKDRDEFFENKNIDELEPEGRLYLEESSEIFAALDKMIKDDRKVDTIYVSSLFHHFDDALLSILFNMMKEVLNDDGHLAFTLKELGELEEKGVSLIRDETRFMRKGKEKLRVNHNAFLSPDGQIRHFRDANEIERIAEEAGFSHRSMSHFNVENHDVPGDIQKFLNFIFKKKH
jgi:hypothetical protein